jgi:hypothetical protein
MDPEQTPPVAPPAVPPTPAPAAAHDAALAELTRNRAELETYRAADAQRAAVARAEQEAKLVQKGQAEEVKNFYTKELAEKEKAFQALQERTRSAEKGRALSQALAGKGLSYPEAVADLQTLWANDFEVVDGPNGEFIVRDKASLRPADQVVAERLALPRYAPFLSPSSRGGGANGGGSPLPSGSGQGGEVLPYDQQVLAMWNAGKQQQANGPIWQQDWRSAAKN